ncbi:hypothetical protein ACGFX4_38780 [Kitasatospora sp. NPDC048365]|uniref:hypothetical protein n=1 Tax=Kitasatospora sp. NPDC048365 TaxID=3364050 RepID=UPI00371CCB76
MVEELLAAAAPAGRDEDGALAVLVQRRGWVVQRVQHGVQQPVPAARPAEGRHVRAQP